MQEEKVEQINDKEEEEELANLKKNGLFSRVLMEEDRGEEGKRLTRTALKKSVKVAARK